MSLYIIPIVLLCITSPALIAYSNLEIDNVKQEQALSKIEENKTTLRTAYEYDERDTHVPGTNKAQREQLNRLNTGTQEIIDQKLDNDRTPRSPSRDGEKPQPSVSK